MPKMLKDGSREKKSKGFPKSSEVNFAGCTKTAEEIFGKQPITPGVMVKKLWATIKENNLKVKQ